MDQQGGHTEMDFGRQGTGGTDAPAWFLERADGSSPRIAIDQFPFLIGRGTECQIQPSSPTVSRIHAEFKPSSASGFLFLVDRHSTNGTYVNGNVVREPVPINHSDVLRFGGEEWRLIQGGQQNNHARTVRRMPLILCDEPEAVAAGS